MKYRILIITLLFTILNINNTFANQQKLEKLKIISKNIRCLVCQGQSIDESNSDFAINIKKIILSKLNDDLTEDEIYTFLKSKYGEWIIYKPEFNIYNFFLWFTPYFVLFLGGIYIFFKIIKKSRKIT
tara:strand:+ start:262 stop:645 length:384 start_codon:yes stop_codon:yes gene_type:complete